MAGTIVRIKCRNFLTYGSIETFPGDKLNVIIGPNGTGKSTVACAIVLGLGGKPTVIGRSKQLSAYVQYGQNKASVEIELLNPDGDNYVIKRVFDTKNESKWSVNGRLTTEQQVRTLVSKLNIQIDNLCQFLPQDRVQDFAKMNKQQLFYNTLKSIGGIEMETTMDKLKKLQINFTSLKKTIESKTSTLNQETIDNQRLEGEVENNNERKKLVDHIELMNQKRMWLQYDNKCKEKDTLQNETAAIRRKLDSEKQKVKPMEEKLKEINQNIKHTMARMDPLTNTKKQNYTVLMKVKEQRACLKGDIEMSEDRMKHMGDEESSIRKEIDNNKMLLSAASNDVRGFSEADISAQIRALSAELKEEVDNANNVKSAKRQCESQIEGVQMKLSTVERRLGRLRNVRHQREELLSQLSEDAMKATHWLRENKHLFSGEVHEPMILDINIKKPEYARQLEALISRDDLIAFSCENAADTGVLLRELREKRRWRVNIVTIPDAQKRQSIKPQPVPISQLRMFGFECYANEVIEAPDGIQMYLFLNYNLTTIPIGGKQVASHHYRSSIPKQFSTYFSDESMYQVFTSQYSGNVISSTNPLKPDIQYFNVSADWALIQELDNEIRQLSGERANLNAKIPALDEQLKTLEASYSEKRTVYNEARQKVEARRAAQKKVEHLEAKIRSLEDGLRAHAGKETQYKQQIKENLCKILALCKKIPGYCNNVIQSEEKVDLFKLVLNQDRKSLARYETEFAESREVLERIEQAVDESEQRLNICKQEAKRLYRDAMEATGGVSPHEERSQLAAKFNKLSNDLDKLEARIKKQKAELTCLPEVNDNVFQEYEARQNRIASLQKTLQDLNTSLNSTEATIEAIKSTWLPEIQGYIQQINVKYSAYFREMNCAGEVELHLPENEYDFENYGITIRVKFRGESDLKELDGHRQSGGERAVSTALYMLAMQGLTSVPFRLVDEINQGMDVINERKVFQLLLRIVDHASTACQYFLITPKLLGNMEYSDGTKVKCIFNGEHAQSHEEFNVARFIEVARRNRDV